MKEQVLVTGGCGSIGERLIRSLLDEGGYGVVNVDRNLCSLNSTADYEFIQGDLRSIDLAGIIRDNDCRYIVHLAAESDERGSFDNVLGFHTTNVSGTLRVLEAARHTDVSHTILLSSIAVKADDGGQVRTPRSPYAATKLAGEMFAEVHARLHEMHISILRIADIYGQGVKGSELQDLLNTCQREDEVGLCNESRFFHPVHIDDVVRSIATMLPSPKGFRTFELGDATRISDEDVISLVSSILNKHFDIERVQDRRAFNSVPPDTDGIRALLGQEVFRDVRSGLAHALDG